MTRPERLTTRAERQTLRSIKRVCYAGLDSVTLRAEVVRRASTVLPAEGCGLMVADSATGLFTHGWAVGLPDRFIHAYREQVYPEEASLFLDLVRSGIITTNYDSERFLAVLRESGFAHSLHAVLCSGGTLVAAWCLFREPSSRSFDEKEMRFVRAVAPHVANGLRAAAAIDNSRQAGAEAVSAAPGVVIVDASHRITLRSGPAAAQLEDLADVGAEDPGQMPYAVVSVLARLTWNGHTLDSQPLHAELRSQGRSGQWYLLRAARAEPDAADNASTVVVIEPASPRDSALPLGWFYDLSQRQHEVLVLVLRGESTKRIAERLGLSPHTVQDHLNVACEKVGVRGRKALVAKVIRDAVPVQLMPAPAT